MSAAAAAATRTPPAHRPDTTAAVELADVSFAYDTRPMLTGITMTIPRGKVVAIMGGSGCGKTTILRLIGGQLKPKSGTRARSRGQSVPDLDRDALYALRRKCGMLFQFGALFTDMTVFENIAFAMREHTELPEELIRDLVLMKLHAVGLARRRAADAVRALRRHGAPRRARARDRARPDARACTTSRSPGSIRFRSASSGS